MDKRIYLKVKIKSLAEEAKIIRKEEARNPEFRLGLAEHRKGIVRNEARHTLLAYAFLRGKDYKQVEPKCHEKPEWSRVESMIIKYGVYWADDMSHDDYKKAKYEESVRFKEWKSSLEK